MPPTRTPSDRDERYDELIARAPTPPRLHDNDDPATTNRGRRRADRALDARTRAKELTGAGSRQG